MKRAFLIAVAVAAMTLFAPLAANAKGEPTDPGAKDQPSESQLIEHGHYTNKSGSTVHSPARTKDDKKPKGATAKCRDGTWRFSQNHRGTCSHHGGVSEWVDRAVRSSHMVKLYEVGE